jgi:hypothetical protein
LQCCLSGIFSCNLYFCFAKPADSLACLLDNQDLFPVSGVAIDSFWPADIFSDRNNVDSLPGDHEASTDHNKRSETFPVS